MSTDPPWFRRWFGFSFLPVSWQGWAVTVAFAVFEIVLGTVTFGVPAHPLIWWLAATAGFAAFLGFWALVLWKME